MIQASENLWKITCKYAPLSCIYNELLSLWVNQYIFWHSHITRWTAVATDSEGHHISSLKYLNISILWRCRRCFRKNECPVSKDLTFNNKKVLREFICLNTYFCLFKLGVIKPQTAYFSIKVHNTYSFGAPLRSHSSEYLCASVVNYEDTYTPITLFILQLCFCFTRVINYLSSTYKYTAMQNSPHLPWIKLYHTAWKVYDSVNLDLFFLWKYMGELALY